MSEPDDTMPGPDGAEALAEPRYAEDERTTLIDFLDYFRGVLLRKVSGLTDAQARATAGASPMHLLGLIRHMAEVERGWFQNGLAGLTLPPRYYSDAEPDGDFFPPPEATLAEALDSWRHEVAEANEVIARWDSLDATYEHPRRGAVSARWVIVHMIEEYARHCGHADIIRETVDGATGD